MDILKAVQAYVSKMITEVPGMKVLLLDSHTVGHIPPPRQARLTGSRRL